MHYTQRLKLDAASRVVVFDRTDPHPSPAARVAMDRLEALLAHVEEVEESQRRSQQEARGALLERDCAGESLTLRLSQLGKLLAAVAAAEGQPQLRFRLARNGKYGCLALAREAHTILRHLDALTSFRFAGNPAQLAVWEAASAVRWNRREGSGGASAPPVGVMG